MKTWQIIQGQSRSAKENMEADASYLSQMREDSAPILHIHKWKRPSATYGYFFSLDQHVKKGHETFDLARRPTGGGMVFHAFDISFAVIMPLTLKGVSGNTLTNYQLVNHKVLKAIETFLQEYGAKDFSKLFSLLDEDDQKVGGERRYFCMAKPTIYDVVLSNGQKVAGAAQRKGRHALLHQGTLSLNLPRQEVMEGVLKESDTIYPAMEKTSFAIMDELKLRGADLEKGKARLIELLIKEITTLGAV